MNKEKHDCLVWHKITITKYSYQWHSDSGCHPVWYYYGVTPLPALPTVTKCKKLMVRSAYVHIRKLPLIINSVGLLNFSDYGLDSNMHTVYVLQQIVNENGPWSILACLKKSNLKNSDWNLEALEPLDFVRPTALPVVSRMHYWGHLLHAYWFFSVLWIGGWLSKLLSRKFGLCVFFRSCHFLNFPKISKTFYTKFGCHLPPP